MADLRISDSLCPLNRPIVKSDEPLVIVPDHWRVRSVLIPFVIE